MSVVYMSGYPEDVITQQGALDPRVNYLQKPFALNILAARVREALGLF